MIPTRSGPRDLSNTVGGVPERFDPGVHTDGLIEAEHLNRYLWTSRFLPPGSILDAGCGAAYGSAILAVDERSRVTGVDLAGDVLDAVRASAPPNVVLVHGDLRRLDAADGAFDAIVCFEVIEHVHEPFEIMAELRRVLAPDGILAVSTPNALVGDDSNPHHHHELTPDELTSMLEEHFTHVRFHYQGAWIASAVLAADAHSGTDLDGTMTSTFKVQSQDVARAPYLVAIASNRELPDPAPAIVLTTPVELDHWSDLWQAQRAVIDDQVALLDEQVALMADQLALIGQLQDELARANKISGR